MKEIDKLNYRPFTRFCMSIGAVPSSYLAGLSIEEQLLWLCSYLEKEVIPAVNNNGEAVEELQNLYVELKSYVDNYFDNLDVQEEINNKLDDMAESGDLEEIIASYINTKAIFGYDNVNSMINAENLANGCYARTLGYYEKNDGGTATYKIRTITNDDVVDDMTIIEMSDNTLVAELIVENNTINANQIGCKADDETFDNGIKLNTILNYCNEKGINFEFFTGQYYVNTPITILEKLYAITIKGCMPKSNLNGTALVYTGTGYCLTLAKGGLKYTIKDLAITCNNTNSGINCDGVVSTTINFKNYLTNISVSSAIIGMRIVATTYTFIDNYTFGGSSNTEVGLYILGFEFTYLNHCSLDGYSATDGDSIGLKIDGGLNYYIDNIDICNFGTGKAIYITNNNYNLYSVYFDKVNIIRCDGGVVMDAKNNMSSISFDNILISQSGTTEGSYYFHAIKNSYDVQNVSIKNLTIRNLATTHLPDYIYESTGTIVNLLLEVKDAYSLPIEKQGIKGTTYDNYIYKNNTIRSSVMKYITTDGTSSNYTIAVKYPKMTNIPFMDIYVVGHNDYFLYNPQYDDTTNELKQIVHFTAPPSTGNVRIAYRIDEKGSSM